MLWKRMTCCAGRFGADYAKSYLEVKHTEWDEYAEMTAKSVTAWEVQRYLSL